MDMSNLAYVYKDESDLQYKPAPLDEERFERIFGTVYAMSSPNAVHQTIAIKIASQLNTFFEGKPCTPYAAPFDLYPLADLGLASQVRDDTETVVQPDAFVVCDRDRLKLNGYFGPPPLVIEILSQNRSHDLVTKLNLYHKAGIQEYIVIDPEYKIVMIFSWTAEAYRYNAYDFSDKIPSRHFEGLFFDLSFPLPF
jgi:Uma2 family endonuclease